MQRDQLPRFRQSANYVLPRWKLVYVSNPKAACTSIKWILADLQRVKPKSFYRTLRPETLRDGTIHHGARDAWPDTPRLKSLTDAELAAITPENGWLVFSASRHPASRLWSAWQSKLLLRQPTYASRFGKEAWFPRLPRTSTEVLDDWFTFVEHLHDDPTTRILQDPHFRPQAQLLAVHDMSYDRIYDTSEFSSLLTDLTAHLRRLGWDGEIHVRRSNETPLPALAAAYPARVLDVIHGIYGADYDAFGYPRTVPRGAREEDSYSDDLVATVGIVVDRHLRITDLARTARSLERRVQRLRQGA